MIRLLRGFAIVALAVAVVLFGVAQVLDRLGQDGTVPTLTADSDTLELSCAYTEEQLLEGVAAWDEKDGDLTDQIIVGSFTRFLEPGVCDLSYVVFDSAEHMATLTRRVHFTDYHSPQFALAQPLCFEESMTNNTEVRALFSASDLLDGDLTSWISYVETTAAYGVPGDYTITMEVRNSFGDTVSYDFPIHIYERDSQNVDITLTTPLVYVDQGDSFEALDYVDTVSGPDGETYEAAQLEVNSGVDTATPGLYEVHYAYDSGESLEEGGQYGQIWLTVIVQEVGQ